MTLPEHLRPIVGDMVVAPNRWTELGVTHWHCVEREPSKVSDSKRFGHERMLAERLQRQAEPVHTPHGVVEWLTAVTEDLAARHSLTEEQLQASGMDEVGLKGRREIWRGMAEHGMDVCRVLAVSERRVVHFNAYAMTAAGCTKH